MLLLGFRRVLLRCHRLVDLDLGHGIDDQVPLECLRARHACWVLTLLEQLARRLTVVVNLFLVRLLQEGVRHAINVDRVLIGKLRIEVQRALRIHIAALLVAENVVDPASESLRNVVGLERFS